MRRRFAATGRKLDVKDKTLHDEQDTPSPAPRVAAANRLLTLAGSGSLCVLLIVLLMLPRRPTSALGWLAYVLTLSILVVVFFGLGQILMYLERSRSHRLASRALGFLVAVVPGLALIYLLFSHASFVMQYFQ